MSLLRHSVWAAAATATLSVARFSLAAIIAHRLVQAAYGQFAYGQWLVAVAFLLSSLGATGFISRYIAEYRNDTELVSAIIRRWFPAALALPALAAVLAPIGAWLSGLVLSPYAFSMLALWVLASGIWAMLTGALTGLQRFDIIFAGNVIAAVTMVGGALLLPLGQADPGGVFALMAAACSGGVLVSTYGTREIPRGPRAHIEPDLWRRMIRYALNVWLTALLWTLVWSRGELPIVRGYLGDRGVARYAPALALLAGAMQAAMLGVGGVAPQLTRFWGEGRVDEAVSTARVVMDLQLAACTTLALVLICLGPELVTLAFGRAYRNSAEPLAILAVGLLAMAVSLQNHLLQIATDARYNRNIMLLGVCMLFGLATYSTKRSGLDGAAIARAGTVLALACISIWAVIRRWGRAAASLRNVVIATVLTAIALFCVLEGVMTQLLPRAALLAGSITVLTVTLKDSGGRPVWRSYLAVFRTRQQPISTESLS